ncbi:MAG: Xaa-Pro peptidase family protein [Armatimonadota bacterium]|nr:Xaa-Pro peptidase family protein [Armatimonadota bacterium]MDR7438472.1 Xaa-Pro peptidase family protein [Armatimonadota bacterium]MDR7563169.1 Xaa-Pro peptidase family protein [Armatimonadota bacterium]MDR7567160.1 Xaa-Pro peptidase family protein [Armatimonadota bacterium]MDR7602312.1 Xaa-Pro peptidase family protein [Armatimonadota bacterium]
MRVDRLDDLRRRMAQAGTDLVVLPPGEDFLYLTGRSPLRDERACFLLISSDQALLLVPRLQVGELAPLGLPLFPYADAEGPARAAQEAVRAVGRVRTVAVADDLRADHLLLLQELLPDARFTLASSLLAPLRMRKDPEELDALRRSAAAADAGVLAAARSCRPGVSEHEVAEAAGTAMKQAGAEEVLFTLVASGPNSAFPHHRTSLRPLQAGEPVLVDLGSRVWGYCSDLTRMVLLGPPPESYREVHGIVEEAVQAALEVIRPGIPLGEVDRAARQVIAKAGYADRFVHRTGHGLGLAPHEPPSVTEPNPTLLCEGMVFTVEPGIYLPGAFGVRLEEAIIVHPTGPEVLSRLGREALEGSV